jgi:hypothetical protein
MKYPLATLALLFAACGETTPLVDTGALTSEGKHFAEAREYVNLGPPGCSQPELSCATILTLCTDGRADWFPGGDIVWPYAYEVDGNSIVLSDGDIEGELQFTILNDTQIETEAEIVLDLYGASDPACP